ncbi:hypothetical protein SEA_FRANCOB_9 [Streptomyces phage Francob]
MDPQKRAEWLTAQIKSQKAIKGQFEKEGNELGAKRAEKEIKKMQKELDRLV